MQSIYKVIEYGTEKQVMRCDYEIKSYDKDDAQFKLFQIKLSMLSAHAFDI